MTFSAERAPGLRHVQFIPVCHLESDNPKSSTTLTYCIWILDDDDDDDDAAAAT